MEISTNSQVTYLFLNGIRSASSIQLNEWVTLQSADMSHIDFETALAICKNARDLPVALAYIPLVSAQLVVQGDTPEETARFAWNAAWEALLLSALFNCEVGFNLQSDEPASSIGASGELRATNFYMRGLVNSEAYELTDGDRNWLERHYDCFSDLMVDERFRSAIHCMATYRWHSLPRIQLAVLWAGIEGIFGASSEIRFRLALYAARFLHPDDESERQLTFSDVKKLYDVRSAAVHGSKLKNNVSETVASSAALLQRIIIKCFEVQAIPDEKQLVP